MLCPRVKNCTVILGELANIPKLVLKRYITGSWCTDLEHTRQKVICGAEKLSQAILDKLLSLAWCT